LNSIGLGIRQNVDYPLSRLARQVPTKGHLKFLVTVGYLNKTVEK